MNNKKWGNQRATLTARTPQRLNATLGTDAPGASTTDLCNTSPIFLNMSAGKTYLPLVIWTHVQVAQYDFWPNFLIKFLVRGPVISWPKIQLEDKNRLRCGMERHLLVKMLLMVSLGISGKQKIATAQVMRQFARWMTIFLIMKINNNILGGIRFKGNRILLLLLLLLMLPGATLIVCWLFFFLISMFCCSRTHWTCSKKNKQTKCWQ